MAQKCVGGMGKGAGGRGGGGVEGGREEEGRGYKLSFARYWLAGQQSHHPPQHKLSIVCKQSVS